MPRRSNLAKRSLARDLLNGFFESRDNAGPHLFERAAHERALLDRRMLNAPGEDLLASEHEREGLFVHRHDLVRVTRPVFMEFGIWRDAAAALNIAGDRVARD